MKTRSVKAALAVLALSTLPSLTQAADKAPVYFCESVDPTIRVSLSLEDRTHEEVDFIESITGDSHIVHEGSVVTTGMGDIYLNHGINLVTKNQIDPNMVNFRIHRQGEDGKLKQFDGFVTLNLVNPKINSTLYLATMRPVELACERSDRFASIAGYIKARKAALLRAPGVKASSVESTSTSTSGVDESIAEFQKKMDKLKEAIQKNDEIIKGLPNLDKKDDSSTETNGSPEPTDYPPVPEDSPYDSADDQG